MQWRRSALVRLSIVGGLIVAANVSAKQASAPRADNGVIDSRADAALKRMSSYVGGLKSFRPLSRRPSSPRPWSCAGRSSSGERQRSQSGPGRRRSSRSASSEALCA
jgi:hypothetical protein